MSSLPPNVLVALGSFLLFLACFGWRQPRVYLAIANWGHPVQGLDEPADLFYARVYQRLQERLSEAELPDSKIGFGPGHLFANRTVFGARPQYLVVRYAEFTIYLYAYRMPYGIYVSYWAFNKYMLWLEHPILKWVLGWRTYQMTLYQYDVTSMCLITINSALHEVIDEYCAERGLKPLEEFERRPILHSFYAKYKQGNQPPSGYMLPVQTTIPAQMATPAETAPPVPLTMPPVSTPTTSLSATVPAAVSVDS